MTTDLQRPKTRVLIAVPTRRFRPEHVDEDVPEHLKQMLGILNADEASPYIFEMMLFAGGNVARGRNKIIASFLRGPWNWLSFIDDDVFDDPYVMAAAQLKILSRRLHVCGALYTTKSIDARWVLNTYREPAIDATGLLRLPELGTGGMKTYHRSTFEKVIAAEPDLAYVDDESAAPEWGIFSMGVVDVDGKRRWLPEDYWCDQLFRRHGIPVHVDTTIKLKHRDVDGQVYPIEDDWPELPGPMSAITPPPTAEDSPLSSIPKMKLMICLQYWAGDRKAAIRLAKFIVDLEPSFRADVELCLVHRHDAEAPDKDLLRYVGAKMPVRVHQSPVHKAGYPVSPNVMAFDVMTTALKWECDAVLLMEADCVPVAKGWIEQLKDEWRRARSNDCLVLGSWRPECSMRGHINGNLMFHPQTARILALELPPSKKAWDIFFVKQFHTRWMRTGLIANRYQEMFVPAEKMSAPECGTKAPVLVHGIKDESAWRYAAVQTGIKA
jgi:hypothetical protein